MQSYLLDTGVLLRAFDRTFAEHEQIRDFLRQSRARGDELVTTTQNLAEFWNVSTRPQSARGGFGRSTAETRRRLDFIERYMTVETDNHRSFHCWKKLLMDHDIKGTSVHDARLVAIMAARGIDNLVTLNGADFNRYGISVHSPNDLIGVSGKA